MAEGATPAERTTGGKEAGGIPGVRQAAVARVASANPALKGLTGGRQAGRPHDQPTGTFRGGIAPHGGVYYGGGKRGGGTVNEGRRNYRIGGQPGKRYSGYDPTGQRRYAQV